jgi:hypothetical protein
VKNRDVLVLVSVILAILLPSWQVLAAKPKKTLQASPPATHAPNDSAKPTGAEATPQEIDNAIERSKTFLYAHLSNGSWEGAPNAADRNSGGHTAIAIHALLAAGENVNDPRLRPAVDQLLKWPMRCPYVVCQRDQALEMMPRTKENRAAAWMDGQLLATSRRTKGQAKALYHYLPEDDDTYDQSVSQYGVLGMWACAETGFEVPTGYWESTENAWQHHQNASGGWSYVMGGTGSQGEQTCSMTAAGVATLFITQDYVHSGEGLFPKGNIENPSIDRGMAWLSKNFALVFSNPSQIKDGQTYTLYGIERVGVAGGYKYFGGHDWYREGARWLLSHQKGDGSWEGIGGPIPSTCFAMFFLTRGREPVAFNKLQYDCLVGGKSELAHWNERPRDIAKITRWIEKSTERNLNWHIVSLKDTTADVLSEAPIVYIAGNQPLELTLEDEAKLKRFVENGGVILANPDGGSENLVKSFQKLAAKLFPMYEMRPLPADHPMYTHEQFRGDEIRKKDGLLGVSNGVRELMVIPTNDWGKAWQGDQASNRDAFRLADNLYVYAVGHTPFRHGGPGVVHADKAITADTTVKMARLDYSGNADPEPAGWRRIAALLHNNAKIDLEVQTVKLGANKLGGFKLAHVTGTTAFTWTAAQRAEIKAYVQGGGLLLIDAAGGSKAFADAAEKELLAIFPNQAAQISPLANSDPLYQGVDFRYRRYLRPGETIHSGPDLRGLKINGHWAVLLSRQDISNALVGRDVDGVVGYTPESATAFVVNLVKQVGN